MNPVMSLASTSVYSIPMLLFVGWRGEPGKRDEPQHVTQGKATPGLLGGLSMRGRSLNTRNIRIVSYLKYIN